MFGLLSYWKAKRERRAINSSSIASNPARLRLSDARLRRLCPSLYLTTGIRGLVRCLFGEGLGTREFIRDMLVHGDSRAAVVLQSHPLLVACYCDDSDAVCVLQFREGDIGGSEHCVGDRLLTVLNSCVFDRPALAVGVAADLVQGDAAKPRYVNFWPLVADFLSDDTAEIEQRKAAISDREFARCRSLGEQHLRELPGRVRAGRPDQSHLPAD